MPTISVTPGDIGQKTDKNNLLTYSITTDGEMSTITEKINGTVVNTRTANSGDAITLGLTQAQWDAIRFGKYADATGGKNTLTVEMGTEKWTYTFDKRLATDADILSAVKATKDANEVYLPSVKKQLADAINAKGGSVSANADWLTMINGIKSSSSGRKASGTITSASSTKTFTLDNGNQGTVPYVDFDFSLLPFIPQKIDFIASNLSENYTNEWKKDNFYSSGTNYANVRSVGSAFRVPYSNTLVSIPVGNASKLYTWQAYE